MTQQELQDLARRAEDLYRRRWKDDLERDCRDMYVAIDPERERFFIGHTMSEATTKARQDAPRCLTHMIRIGHAAAVHIGNS